MVQRRIRISLGDVALTATLDEGETADLVWDALPIESSASTWDDEIYFCTPVSVGELADADAVDVQAVGAIAYWPPGQALCLFFGPTPASTGDEPKVASPVNPVGAVDGAASVLKSVPSGASVLVERT